MTSAKGELISIRCARPVSPLRPDLKRILPNGPPAVQAVFDDSYRKPLLDERGLHHPGHRASKDRRLRVVGMIPQEAESE